MGLDGMSATSGIEALDGMTGMSGMEGMSGMNGMQGMSGMSGLHGMDNELIEKLSNARKAYWDKDTKGASKIYEELVVAKPEHPDLLVEYGNLLVQTKQFKKAVGTYDKAANLLIDQKRYREVRPLVEFIGNFDRPRAEKIIEKLRSSQ
jgi:tetratricopeptide (TPR) repeat protein